MLFPTNFLGWCFMYWITSHSELSRCLSPLSSILGSWISYPNPTFMLFWSYRILHYIFSKAFQELHCKRLFLLLFECNWIIFIVMRIRNRIHDVRSPPVCWKILVRGKDDKQQINSPCSRQFSLGDSGWGVVNGQSSLSLSPRLFP